MAQVGSRATGKQAAGVEDEDVIDNPAEGEAEENLSNQGDTRLVDGGEANETEDNLTEEEREARRQANRQRRQAKKERQRKMRADQEALIDRLQSESADMKRRLAAVEGRSVAADVAVVDDKLGQAKKYVEDARNLKKRILASNDPEQLAKLDDVDEAIYQGRKAVEQLESYKGQMERQSATPAPFDDTVVTMAKGWASRHDWFDPRGGDEESQLVLTLDNQVKASGLDPSTKAYWNALDAKIAKYLPHRAEGGNDADGDGDGDNNDADGDGDGDEGDNSGGTDASSLTPRNRPRINRPIVGGGGRERPNGGGGRVKIFTLSPGRREAMRQEGLEPGSKEWDKRVETFKAYDRTHPGAA